jgi:hypothetical protein
MMLKHSATRTKGHPSAGTSSPAGGVERRLVDQADFDARLVEADDGVEGAVERVAERDDVAAAGRGLADDVVVAGFEFVAVAEEGLAVFAEDVGTALLVEKTKRRPGSLKMRSTTLRNWCWSAGK